MKSSPRWVGRLVRAAVCGLLAAAAMPAIAFADATKSFSVPISGTFADSCTGELFLFTGTDHFSFQDQSDGTLKLQSYMNGTGVSLTGGVHYTATEESHTWIFGPDSETFAVYDYQKIDRSGEISTTPGGDDFFVRVFASFPTKAGVPDMNSLSTGVDGACR